MDDFSFLTPQAASGQGPTNPQSLQAALQALTPEQRRQLFEPYQHELSVYEQQMQPTQHRTALAAVLGGIGNTMANMQRMDTLHRMQAQAQALTGAYAGSGGMDPQRAAMVQALRARQQNALPADPNSPPPEMTEA